MYEVEYNKYKDKKEEVKEEVKEDKIFCVDCIQEKFESTKLDNVDLNFESNKCKLHNYNLNHYCIDCKKKYLHFLYKRR